MLNFLINYGGTIIVGAIVLAVIVCIIAGIVRDKRKGKSCSCGCGCSECPSSGICHKK